MISFRHAVLLTTTLALAACGGSSGTDAPVPVAPPTPTPPPQAENAAPVFSSTSSVSVAESVTGTAYTATASDADGNSLSFSISGGSDAIHFSIDAVTGNLSFNTAPDFENPSDSDGDNIYDFTLAVADGQGGTDSLDVNLSLTDVANDPVKYRDRFFTEIDEMRDVELAVIDGETLQMDTFQPANDRTQNRPVLIVA